MRHTKSEVKNTIERFQSIIDFNPDTHTYSVEGIVRPSVSELMAPLSALEYGTTKPSYFAKKAMALGSNVHKAIQAYAELGFITEDPDILPYLNGYRTLIDESGYELIESEAKLMGNGYCGTADLIFWKEKFEETILVDVKTGTTDHPMLWDTQIQFYLNAIRFMGLACRTAFVLKLDAKGGFRVYPYDMLKPDVCEELKRIHDWRKERGEV